MKINNLLNDEFLNAYNELMNQQLEVPIAKIIANNYLRIQEAIDEYESVRLSTIYDNAQKNDEKILVDSDNMPVIYDCNIEQIAAIMEPFLNKEVELLTIDSNYIKYITPKSLLLLRDIIK